MGYYVAVAIVGSVMSAVGVGLAVFEMLKVVFSVALTLAPSGATGAVPMGASQLQPNVGLLLIGVLILIIGVLLVLAGLFGSLYKLIADAVAEGRRLSELDDESVAGDTETEDDEATDDDADGESDADATEPESSAGGGGDDDTDGDTGATDSDPDDGGDDTTDEDADDAGSQP
jgi:hypothetical protein